MGQGAMQAVRRALLRATSVLQFMMLSLGIPILVSSPLFPKYIPTNSLEKAVQFGLCVWALSNTVKNQEGIPGF